MQGNHPETPVLQALRQGIQTELQGLTFYRKAAEMSSDEKGKQVFRSLAHEEIGHLRLLKVQYGSLVNEGRWVEMQQACDMEAGAEIEQLFPQSDDALAEMLTPGSSDLQSLEIALDFERRGFQLYRRLGEETTDPAGQALYRFLGQQEQKHYEFIQRAQEYLQNEGAWYFDEQELPMFDGG